MKTKRFIVTMLLFIMATLALTSCAEKSNWETRVVENSAENIYDCSFSDYSKTYGRNYFEYESYIRWYSNSTQTISFRKIMPENPPTYELSGFSLYIDDLSGANLPTIISKKVVINGQENFVPEKNYSTLQFTYVNHVKNEEQIVAVDLYFAYTTPIALDMTIEVIIEYKYGEDGEVKSFSFVFPMSECRA
jgi:hypothetical protein